MTDTIELLEAFADAFNRHDLDAVMGMMTDDCVFLASAGTEAEGTRFEGQVAVRQAFADVFKRFPDARWNDDEHFVAGDRACSQWRFTATLPDGGKLNILGCDLFHLRDGKIRVKNALRKQMPG